MDATTNPDYGTRATAPLSRDEQLALLRVALRVKLKRAGLAPDTVHIVADEAALPLAQQPTISSTPRPLAA